jgi:hypothetical protein
MLTRFPSAVLAIILIVAGIFSPRPQTAVGSEYFPQTGHFVENEFLAFYQQAARPDLLYGYPISRAFFDESIGRSVQYFQRARFELYPENPSELRVKLSPLGVLTYNPGETVPVTDSGPACRTFPETGFQVCYSFLDFFQANGGIVQFGAPISGFEQHEGRIVQYFQFSRLEWHPERAAGDRVVISDLGARYSLQINLDSSATSPERRENLLLTVLSLNARAYTSRGVTPLQGKQTVTVVVRDHNNRPLPGAQVELVVTLPNGERTRYTLENSDANGFSRHSFDFASRLPGVARITVIVSYGDLQKETTTSFRLWW